MEKYICKFAYECNVEKIECNHNNPHQRFDQCKIEICNSFDQEVECIKVNLGINPDEILSLAFPQKKNEY
jgi:hypothetical protein